MKQHGLAIVLAIGVILAAARIFLGCAATPEQKSAAADSAYAADQLDCVRISSTRAEADACRAARRATWDAGTEGGAR